MSVSVVIPAYNYAHFLPQTLRSVLGQGTEGMPVEIIVVDDGSTDDTAAVAQSYGSAVRYVHQHNQGLSAARNTGMEHATGRALVFLDADDLLTPGVLASQWATLQAHPEAQVSICRNWLINAPTPTSPLRTQGYYPLYGGSFGVHLCCANAAPVHAHMVLRATARQAGTFDTSLRGCEDYDFWLRCLAVGGGFVSNPQGAVLYRKHRASMSAQTESQAVFESICNRRVGAMLERNANLLKERRLDAWLAHAFGSLKRAKSLACMQAGLAVALLEQAARAVRQATHICGSGMVCSDADAESLGTERPRTEAEICVLRYYVLRTLSALWDFAPLGHAPLEAAMASLERLFPGWGGPASLLPQAWEELLPHLHLPQEPSDVTDEGGRYTGAVFQA